MRVANPINADTIPRGLTLAAQWGLTHLMAGHVHGEGWLYMEVLLAPFQRFFREHSESCRNARRRRS